MRYLLIIAHDEAFIPTESLVADIGRWIRDMRQRGVWVEGNPLRPPSEATTVRVRGGQVRATQGPFAKSKEKMCAYALIECSTRDDALDIASRHPMAKVATIEVRPVWDDLTKRR